jgi:hypothetical protein
MAIIRSIPSEKLINGIEVKTSELALISEPTYTTNGEYAIVVKYIETCTINLNSRTTNRIKIKAMSTVLIIPDQNKIDEYWDEIQIEKGSCIELVFVYHNWYILSSDGVKLW